MQKRWMYGDAGDRWPVADGQTWVTEDGRHRFICADVVRDRDALPARIGPVAAVYTDPPWDRGNARAFRTKAGLNDGPVDFDALLDALIVVAVTVCDGDIWLEMGRRGEATLTAALAARGRPVSERWDTTYYRTKPAVLLRAGRAPWTGPDLTGMDDDDTPKAAIAATPEDAVILDLCAGRGLTPLTAADLGRRSVSVELHPRRLAVAIDKVCVITEQTARQEPT